MDGKGRTFIDACRIHRFNLFHTFWISRCYIFFQNIIVFDENFIVQHTHYVGVLAADKENI
jgi:hypothetical protein